MNMIGTIIRETERAVLFEASEGTVFGGKQIWWPLSQATVFGHGGAGYARRDSERLITSRWIAERKAAELGLTAELTAHYDECERLDKEERQIKAARRAGKEAYKAEQQKLVAGAEKQLLAEAA